jgi:hypothetical protein
LLDAELGPLDVGCVVSFEELRALAHATHPVLRERGGFQETASALDDRKRTGDAVGDGELWRKTCHRGPRVGFALGGHRAAAYQ